jgi:hypothetical protein
MSELFLFPDIKELKLSHPNYGNPAYSSANNVKRKYYITVYILLNIL